MAYKLYVCIFLRQLLSCTRHVYGNPIDSLISRHCAPVPTHITSNPISY